MGFRYVSGEIVPEEGMVETTVSREPGLPDDPEKLLSALPASLRDGLKLTVIDYGPLAISDAGDLLMPGGGTGTIHIGKDCVTMTLSGGEKRPLVWLAHRVRWDNDRREITFFWHGVGDPDAERTTIRDGDTLTVRASGAENGIDPSRQFSSWTVTPNPDCSGAWWLVYEVKKP